MANPKDRRMDAEILDCTIRDGGYYCKWDFDDDTVARYLGAVVQAGVHIVEIGFRSKPRAGFAGKYKFCPDGALKRLFANHVDRVRVAVMIDGKDFLLPAGSVDRKNLKECFGSKTDSVVEMVRITATRATLDSVLEIGKWLQGLGYAVSINVMQASLLSEKDLAGIAQRIEESGMDYMVLADSFGGLTPEETRPRFLAIKQHFTRCAGFHGHDNLGLALSNSLAAIEAGAGMVDCALLGMGRGAGNLRTELLLLYLQEKRDRRDLNLTPLFEVASTDFARLHEQYRWGPGVPGRSLPYPLSGMYNTHPMYAQHLLQTHRYSQPEILKVLEDLRGNTSFSEQKLSNSLKKRSANIRDKVPVTKLKGYRPGLPPLKPNVLVLGSGASVRKRAPDIQEYIGKYKPVVIECNVQKEIKSADEHCSLFTNYRRLEEHLSNLTTAKRRRVVLGMDEVGGETARSLDRLEEVFHYPYRVGEGRFVAGPDGCVIPSDVVAMFAFALAMQSGASILHLCGFDGYLPEPDRRGDARMIVETEKMEMQREMVEFLHIFSHQCKETRLVSLTPTAYPTIEQGSLYAELLG
jgi:4-hydroxy 2-oxovalerate aldolase